MSYLILIRHGQSTWNLEKRFTGWVDVDLTENGKLEAKRSGDLIKNQNIDIKYYYSILEQSLNESFLSIEAELEKDNEKLSSTLKIKN